MKKLAILGSTGSIGRQTLEVIDWFPGAFQVVALAAGGSSLELLAKQTLKYQPQMVVIAETTQLAAFKAMLPHFRGQILAGPKAMQEAATLPEVEMVVAAVSGAAGLVPVIKAIKAGKQIALANKEALVTAGNLVMALVKEHHTTLLPVDSEHSAIFQCIGNEQKSVRHLLLTASGGPFRDWPAAEMGKITKVMALKHPNWDMGPKITIDSATLMNKGLEIIEAHWLFDMPYEKIQVVVHQESIIHSLVQFNDSAVLAHLGWPDMRVPIQYALTWPHRQSNPLADLDLPKLAALHFEAPDLERFPCLALAVAAGRAGGIMPAVMNAANEVLVWRFIKEEIGFLDIPKKLEKIIAETANQANPDLDAILAADTEARALAQE